MQYRIKAFLQDTSGRYGILFDEIMTLSLTQIDAIIEDIDNVFAGKYIASSFSGNVSIVEYDCNTSTIRYFDDLIGEEKTIDIYNMLKNYRDKLIEYENE